MRRKVHAEIGAHTRTRLRDAAGRFRAAAGGHYRAVAWPIREARQALQTPASAQSRYGLDWMNFFVADVQTGFGTFVAFDPGAERLVSG